MNLKTEHQVFDGVEFICTQFGAMKSLELFPSVMKLLGPVLEDILKLDLEDDIKLGMMFSGLFKNVSPVEFKSLALELIANTQAKVTREGATKLISLRTPEEIEIAFAGRFPLVLKVCWLSIQVNFGNFTDWLDVSVGEGPAREESNSDSTPTS